MKTILCIDDIQTNLFTLESVLKSAKSEEYSVVTALSAHAGLEILLKDKIDLILLDVMMPELDGFSCAKMIRGNRKTKDIPIIFVTAKTDDETIERCYEVGGDDYVSKPFNSVELLARVAFHLKLKEKERLLEEEKYKILELSLKYEHDANFDKLTKIYNRNMLNNLMEKKLHNRREHDSSFAFVILDIDFFKQVNDIYGHLVGDKVLKQISSLVQQHIRADDIFARWGGEEFVLVFNLEIDKALEIVENLRKYIEAEDFGTAKKVTCSFGLTKFMDGDTLDKLTQRADEALYEAKSTGRNRVCQKI